MLMCGISKLFHCPLRESINTNKNAQKTSDTHIKYGTRYVQGSFTLIFQYPVSNINDFIKL